MTSNEKNTAPIVQLLADAMPKPIIDASGGDVIYRGYAPIGTGQGEAGWRIERETTADGITITEYPQGDMSYNFVWDDRKTYVYSR